MSALTSPYLALARLLTYPDERYAQFAQGVPEILAELKPFSASVEGLSQTELQELFTRTFDLNPTCTLEVGWHLYGEEYARGAFMVSMREQMRRLSVEELGELPDHLTHLLLLVDALEPEERTEFISLYLLPAVRKMAKALEGKENPYGVVVKTVEAVLDRTPGVEAPPEEQKAYEFHIFDNGKASTSDLREEEIPYG